jgi:hypothetical protein
MERFLCNNTLSFKTAPSTLPIASRRLSRFMATVEGGFRPHALYIARAQPAAYGRILSENSGEARNKYLFIPLGRHAVCIL